MLSVSGVLMVPAAADVEGTPSRQAPWDGLSDSCHTTCC